MGAGINNAGQITGLADAGPGVERAFLYNNGVMTALGFPGDGIISTGTAINNAGQITGDYSTPSTSYHAFLYSNGQMTDLGTLGGNYSMGVGINDAGQIVGEYNAVFDYKPFLYSNGMMSDLNTLIDPTLHITLSSVAGINNQGQIIANGSGQGYLLTPVPEPGTWAGLGVGLLLLGWRTRPRAL